MKKLNLLFLFLLYSCGTSPSQNFSGKAMQIGYHVQIGDTLSPTQTTLVEKAIQTTFEEINTTFNDWNPHSEISHLSQLPANQKQKLSPPLLALLQKVTTYHTQSDKKFDITIAPLLILYRTALKKGELPPPEKIQEVAHTLGWEKIHIEDDYLWKEEAGTGFDLGGIAKGLAVDMLTEKLRDLGLTSTYVEWGGEIRVTGKHPSGRPWRVAIENSSQVVELENAAIATSGDYYQSWKVGEKTYFHIVDPLSKKPLEKKSGGIQATTVIAPTCLEADVLATVLMLFEDAKEAETWMAHHFPEIEYTLRYR